MIEVNVLNKVLNRFKIIHIFTCQKFCISPVQKSHYTTKNLSRCDRIPIEYKCALSVNFSSIVIELNVPHDEFSSISDIGFVLFCLC